MKEITVLNNQSLFDISVQEYGTIEGVFEIALANGLSVTDTLVAGQKLKIPEIDQSLVQPEIVDYYKRNDIHPVTGDYNLSLFTFEQQQNFDDMRLLLSWSNKNYDGTSITSFVSQLHTNPDPDGRQIKKYLLRVHLSDPDFLAKVQNPILLIDRRRVRTGISDNYSNRMSGYTHPKPQHWNGRIFEIPLTTQNQIIDLKNEHWFDFSGYGLKVKGVRNSTAHADKYAYTDVGFRIKYLIDGVEKTTPHIARIRLTASYRELGLSASDSRNYVVLSYKRI